MSWGSHHASPGCYGAPRFGTCIAHLRLGASDAGPGTVVDLGLGDPAAQRLARDAKLGTDRQTRGGHRAVVGQMVTDQPHRTGLELRVIGLGHVAILPSQGSGIKPVTAHNVAPGSPPAA